MEDKVNLFKKGALLAQNPKDFEDISDLEEWEKEIIRREKTRKFQFQLFHLLPLFFFLHMD